jgi:hypothetical protein
MHSFLMEVMDSWLGQFPGIDSNQVRLWLGLAVRGIVLLVCERPLFLSLERFQMHGQKVMHKSTVEVQYYSK